METNEPRIDALTVLEYFIEAPLGETRRTLSLAGTVTRTRETTDGGRTPAAGGSATGPEDGRQQRVKRKTTGAARGEHHGSAKVQEADVRRIRREYRGPESGRTIAKELGVSATTVRHIVYRQSWNHIAPEPGEFAPKRKREHEAPENGDAQRAKSLDADEVRRIRREYMTTPISEIARHHRVSETTVVDVANRRSWRRIEPEPDEYVPPPEVEQTRLRRQPHGRQVPRPSESKP